MATNSDAQKEAYSRFVAKNYDQCSASLHALLSSTPRGDPKIQHNVALCEYFKGGCQDAGKFLADLDKLGKSLDGERKVDHPSSIAAVDKLAAQRMQEYRPLILEFEGHEYVRYNEAVVHFHQRQYTNAVERLVPMFHNENQITPLLYARVVLLLLSCTLAQYKKSDAALVTRAKQLLEKLDEVKPFIQKHDKETASEQGLHLRLGDHALLLRAHSEAVTGSSQQALTLLKEFQSSATGSSNWWQIVIYLNNIGMLHLSIGKPHLSSMYLSKAIETYEKSRPKPEGSQPSSGMGLYPSMAAVYYNNGLVHMIRGQQEVAFKSFAVAAPLLKDTPTLWLRMAQCCIRHWQTTLATEQTKAHNEREQLLAATAPNKRVVHLPTPDVLNPPSTKVEAGDEMSMVFAEKCLRNAHYLLLRRYRGRKNRKTGGDDDKAENDAEDDNDEGDGVLEESELHNASAEDPEMAAVLQSVYVNMTYVALCLSNPSVALASAEKLYLLPTLYRENRIVVLSYMAEALCKLGRQEEALAMLQGVNLENLLGGNADSSLTLPCGGIQADAHVTKSADLPKIGSSPVHFGMSSAESNEVSDTYTRALFTNLCAVHIMAGKYSRAQQCLDQFKGEDNPIADLLQLYLYLATGQKDQALSNLRKCPLPPFTVAE